MRFSRAYMGRYEAVSVYDVINKTIEIHKRQVMELKGRIIPLIKALGRQEELNLDFTQVYYALDAMDEYFNDLEQTFIRTAGIWDKVKTWWTKEAPQTDYHKEVNERLKNFIGNISQEFESLGNRLEYIDNEIVKKYGKDDRAVDIRQRLNKAITFINNAIGEYNKLYETDFLMTGK